MMTSHSTPPLTLIEKIATRHSVPGNAAALAGDIITIRPRHVMTHDNTSAVMGKFKAITGDGGAGRIHDPRQPVFAIDHDIQNTSPENLGKYAKIEAFAREQGVDFYPAGTGISHQVMVEEGYVVPGSMVVGSDSHSNLYGAIAALGTPIVRTDAAAIWATGQTWWQVPQVARVTLTGELRPGVVGKDVIIALCGLFNQDEVLNHAVEFHSGGGGGVASLTMDQRMSIANMTTEWGALAGVFPFDEILLDFLYERADYLADRYGEAARHSRTDVDAWYENRLTADDDAHYAVELTLDLSTVIPHVSGPDHVKVMHALPEIEKSRVRINKAYLLSCVNARLEDLTAAARVVDGKKVAEGVEFYVAAASANIQKQAEDLGHWQKLMDAGAIALPPGCGTCIGLGAGTLEPGEVAISATNRNFKGRMGSREAEAYLGSPAVVAASAVTGYICSPTGFEDIEAKTKTIVHGPRKREAGAVEIIDGFPKKVTGRALWLPVDNLNTDGIYSGKMTYRDDVTEEEMAAASMANYDPKFNEIAREGDVIVAGRNFGTGSSREQAATCLKLRGIRCVIAASFSETYKRNAFNNGFIVLECPELSGHLRAESGAGAGAPSPQAPLPGGEGSEPTIVGPDLEIDYERSVIACDGREFGFSPLSTTAQQLIIAGGAENLVRERLTRQGG
ncbi:MAG: homoaconitase [Planctomycetota bacterium]|nr:homoaconitase [Planctomycetota bacterium]